MSEIDYTQLYIQAELETIAQKTEDILADPDGYECSACCIEGQNCDVGLAVKVERERIIKLLEENWVEPMDWLTVEALIKGEQK